MIKRRTLLLALAALIFGSLASTARAHEGMIHVIGVVTGLTAKSVTVQTTGNKNVEVALTGTTTYEKNKKAAALTDLKIGERVVIHAMKMQGGLQAHSVDFSEVSH